MLLRLNPRHRLLTAICTGLTALVVTFYWFGLFWKDAERASQDWLGKNAAARLSTANPRLVFLAIDEDTRTLDALFADDFEKSETLRLMRQGFPWSREVYAHIIERLRSAGASVIIFDMIFPAPREGDEAFRAALVKHAGHVVIGTNFVDKQESGRGLVPYLELPTRDLLPPEGSPSWLGFVNVRTDEDGLVRRIFYRTSILEYTGTRAFDGKQTEVFSLAARALEKAGYAHLIPAQRGPVMFRYAEDIKPQSLHHIFVQSQWEAPPYNKGALFDGKIVLIGASGQASEDRLQTPHGVMIGPQIHLSAINAALNDDFLKETTPVTNVSLILAAGLIAWMLGAWIRRPILRLLLLAAAMFVYWMVAQNVANQFGIVSIWLSPFLALTSSAITWAAWEQVLDRVEQQRARRALERYVGQDVASEVLDNPTSYLNALVGQRRDITILFSDIRGFTTRTETADAHALVSQLNEYFDVMVAIVYANRGTLDKFIGDAVMAHWGSIATAGAQTDAQRAVTTVLQMRQALARLNAGWKARGIEEIKVGFGVNQGEAIVGNLGCISKMEFSAIGDAVNLGSRLEGVTKQYHLDLCIGENVAHLVRDAFLLRSVDLIVVKGKTRPVEIFTVLGKREGVEPPWLSVHEGAMSAYRTGDFAAAAAGWREVLAQNPGDGLSEVFLARCEELQKDPLEAGWAGVYEMKSK